jgi:3-deoxy-D-manno-octulosonate 8-phosphate phosphatase KdsC-like HAD superfamily phosphatase
LKTASLLRRQARVETLRQISKAVLREAGGSGARRESALIVEGRLRGHRWRGGIPDCSGPTPRHEI